MERIMLTKVELENARVDFAIKQKRGLPFILASILIWTMILIVQLLDMPILTKNLFIFSCTAPLFPVALLMSKIIKVDLLDKENPLSSLGILFSMNQLVYILIAMWIYYAVPDKLAMTIAMIFGAHLMPFGWLYKSKIYYVLSIFIPIAALLVGLNFEAYVLALCMILVEIVFCICLVVEHKKEDKNGK